MRVDAAEAALRELNEEAAEAIRVHMDTRAAQLIVNVDGWTRREQVPWMETIADLLAWIVEQAREALRVYLSGPLGDATSRRVCARFAREREERNLVFARPAGAIATRRRRRRTQGVATAAHSRRPGQRVRTGAGLGSDRPRPGAARGPPSTRPPLPPNA